MSSMMIVTPEKEDLLAIKNILSTSWGSTNIVSRGILYNAQRLPAFIAKIESEILGLITYSMQGTQCQIVSLDSLKEGIGIGTSLIEAVKKAASLAGCRRLWVITTNDNMHALGFYQRRGFVIAALHCNALEISRRIKPEIPLFGKDGIPLRDEIELELILSN